MRRLFFSVFILLLVLPSMAQLPVARDTITVIENNTVLKMPWAGGINYSNVSNADLNFDGKKDLVVFDRQNAFGVGIFRCFINIGTSGQTRYKADNNYSYYFPKAYYWAVLLDYNKDGKEDLFCSTGSGIMLYKNISTPANVLRFELVQAKLFSNYNPGGNPYIVDIYASQVGVPGIADIDNDGDIDILTFSPFGSLIEYHKNKTIETNANPDSMPFELSDPCWGRISESNCSVSFNQCTGSSAKAFLQRGDQSRPYHAGSCLLCFDNDGDGDKDLLMGDIACNDMQYVHNSGTSFNDTTKRFPNYPNKGSTTPIRINSFPCAYYVDVDDDGKRDLVASPNAATGENTRTLWYYKNNSTGSNANFVFVKNNLLQDEMIEVGQNAYPLLIDINTDGKKDLLVGTFGYYNNNSLSARLTYYLNTGTLNKPVYTLQTRDYASLSSYGLNNAMPTAGDIDNDGDVDLCIGTGNGKVHWFENTAGAGNPCNFSNFKFDPFGFTTVSAVAAPQLFDLDNDGKLDLIIGTKNGKISYYRNTGSLTQPSYSLQSSFLGSVQVQGDPLIYLNDAYATPYFYREGSSVFALVGSVDGDIYHYAVPSQITSPFTLLNATLNNVNDGAQAVPFYEDANGDGKRDLFIGNASGGLSFFSSASPFVGINETTPDQALRLFPNPAKDQITLQCGADPIQSATVMLFDAKGTLIVQESMQSNWTTLTIKDFPLGLYFITVLSINEKGTHTWRGKLVKE